MNHGHWPGSHTIARIPQLCMPLWDIVAIAFNRDPWDLFSFFLLLLNYCYLAVVFHCFNHQLQLYYRDR